MLAEDSAAKKICAIPLRSFGCVSALFIGTPIAICRKSVQRYNEYMADVTELEGTSKNTGCVYAIPLGLGEGFAHGLYYGPKNAISNFDKPFSKAAFSLDKP